MSTPNPKRQELLLLARDLISQDGLANFSLRGLARAKGIKAPSLYEYFRSVDEILVELRQAEENAFAATLKAATSPELDSTTNITQMLQAYVHFFEGRPDRFEIMFEASKTKYESFDMEIETGSSFRLLQDEMTRLARDLDRPVDEASKWAFAAWAYVHGVCVLRSSFLAELGDALPPLITSGLELFIKGIIAEAQQSS